MFYLVMSGN